MSRERFQEKVRLIFIPYVLATIGLIVIYSFFHWLLVIHWQVVDLKEETINLWIPLVLAFIVPGVILYRRAKLLTYKKDGGHWGVLLFAGMSVIAPLLIAQVYLQQATGKLTWLSTVEEYTQKPATRYYKLKHYYIGKYHAGQYERSEVSGKRNRDLTFHIYIAVPLVEDGADSSMPSGVYWFCKHYSKKVSNSLTYEKKDSLSRSFAQEVALDFQSDSFGQFTYLEIVGNNEYYYPFLKATEKNTALLWQPYSVHRRGRRFCR
jgi:hypothetical protein